MTWPTRPRLAPAQASRRGALRSQAEIAAREGLAALTSEETLAELAAAVIAAHPAQAESYRRGKTALLGFFVGRLLEASGGAADPRRARDLLASLLGHP